MLTAWKLLMIQPTSMPKNPMIRPFVSWICSGVTDTGFVELVAVMRIICHRNVIREQNCHPLQEIRERMCMQKIAVQDKFCRLCKREMYVFPGFAEWKFLPRMVKKISSGDEIPAKEIDVTIRLYGNLQNPVLFAVWYCEKEEIQREMLTMAYKDNKYEGKYVYRVKGECWQWFRFEVRDENGQFLAYSNPLYYGKKEHRLNSYGDALEKLEQKDADQGNII